MGFTLQLAIILVCLFYGARKGGMALGLLGGIGVIILTFVFGVKPGSPPVSVILTITAVVSASATLQAAGGLDVMLQAAERILRRNPKYLSILAPFVTAFLTILSGTGHTVYTIQPIIYDIAIKNGIRPERPMAGSSVASQMGNMAGPVSAPTTAFLALMSTVTINGKHLEPHILLAMSVPATIMGLLAVGIYSWFRGKDLDKDETFQAFIADPENKKYVYGDTATLLDKKTTASQKLSVWIFLGAVAVIAMLGMFKGLRPVFGGKPLDMVQCVQMFMLGSGALMLLFCKVNAANIARNDVFRSGMVAVISVFGVAWMADSMFAAHIGDLKISLGAIMKQHPWAYAVCLLLVSKLVNSQAAALTAMVPVALAIGVDPGHIVAFFPACYGYYILPTYPSDLSAIQFDRSGTTHIGKFVINHSFILPGLIGVGVTSVCSYILAAFYGYI